MVRYVLDVPKNVTIVVAVVALRQCLYSDANTCVVCALIDVCEYLLSG